eukprot:TRINITY_DN7358_c0_g1_i1.p1 TRINITY_DN7358_c0_g1~~TRINITY_DN7358_c0_g1_i1.p1  ORF type:complete len:396 (-),score=120.66 TRINITY_DN7358_c0_g1_i1:141-1328(-)
MAMSLIRTTTVVSSSMAKITPSSVLFPSCIGRTLTTTALNRLVVSSSSSSAPKIPLMPFGIASTSSSSSPMLGMFVRCFAKDETKLTAAQKASQKKTAQKKALQREVKKKTKAKQAAQAQKKKRVYKGPTSVHDLPAPTPLRREKAKPVVVHETVPERTPRDPLVGLPPKYSKISKWVKEGGPNRAKEAMFLNEVFPDAYHAFPVVLPIVAKFNNSFVYLGNPLRASETKQQPVVTWPAPSNEDIFTLALVDIDSPGRDDPTKRPYLHWLVVNIPGNDVSKGQTLTQYLPALPHQGTGQHRLVFLLFSQKTGVVDVSTMNLPVINASDLQQRESFSLKGLAKKFNLSAKSVSFFKTQWDESVTEFYSSQGQSEPVYVLEQLNTNDRYTIPGRRWL